MVFNGNSLVSIICHDILEYFFFLQQLAVLIVPNQPESWGLVVEIISNAQIVWTHFMHGFFGFIYWNKFTSGKDVHFILIIIDIVNINCFLLVFSCVIVIDVVYIINIHCICFLLLLILVSVRVLSCYPPIFHILFFVFSLLQILDPLWTWNIPSDLYAIMRQSFWSYQELLVIWKIFIFELVGSSFPTKYVTVP